MPNAEFKEAEVTINGTRLTSGQSTTLRVAVMSFYSDLEADGLGEDENGAELCEAYKARLVEIIKLMHPGEEK